LPLTGGVHLEITDNQVILPDGPVFRNYYK